jgi:hypothetical protein
MRGVEPPTTRTSSRRAPTRAVKRKLATCRARRNTATSHAMIEPNLAQKGGKPQPRNCGQNARRKAAARRWYQRHLEPARLQLAIAQATRRRRYVSWANVEAIATLYAEAALLTRETGRSHVVDHIIPLKGRTVSGLHVESNLRIIERSENARKSNKRESLGWERPGVSSGDMPLVSSEAPPLQRVLF